MKSNGARQSQRSWPDPASVRRLLVVRAGALGDFILTLPALTSLRVRYSDARITLIGNEAAAALALDRLVDEVVSVDAAWLAPLFAGDSTPRLAAWLGDYDLAVVWLRDPRGAAFGALEALGIPTLRAPSFPADGERRHVADNLLAGLAPLGIHPSGPSVPDLAVNSMGEPFSATAASSDAPASAAHSRASQSAAVTGRSDPARSPVERGRATTPPDVPPAAPLVVAVHPGSGSPRKNWPASSFAEVIRRLTAAGARTLLLAGPADEAAVAAVRESLGPRIFAVATPASVPALAATLRQCAAYVGNDSGVTHLAAALGLPTVAVFGPTDPALWAPHGHRVVVFWGDVVGRTDLTPWPPSAKLDAGEGEAAPDDPPPPTCREHLPTAPKAAAVPAATIPPRPPGRGGQGVRFRPPRHLTRGRRRGAAQLADRMNLYRAPGFALKLEEDCRRPRAALLAGEIAAGLVGYVNPVGVILPRRVARWRAEYPFVEVLT